MISRLFVLLSISCDFGVFVSEIPYIACTRLSSLHLVVHRSRVLSEEIIGEPSLRALKRRLCIDERLGITKIFQRP